ncbi:MAG: ROK family protein [Anaerocolumna sp.]
MKECETILALDLGGTKLLIGEVDLDGRISHSRQYPTGYLTQEQELGLIYSSLDDYISKEGISGKTPKAMGMGLIGQVDQENGIWIMIDPDRKNPIRLSDLLEKKYGIPCSIENDVKAATLAEQIFGAGKDIDDFIYLNIGTGIAAGFIAGGELLRGFENDSGEIGHMTVNYDSNIPCACGRFGCVEAIASGGGMNNRIGQLKERYPGSPLILAAKEGFVRAEQIFEQADAMDALAMKIAFDAVDAIAELILNLVRVSAPRRVVLGGGIGGSSLVTRHLSSRLDLPVMKKVDKGVVPSELDPAKVGLIGAAAVGFLANTSTLI